MSFPPPGSSLLLGDDDWSQLDPSAVLDGFDLGTISPANFDDFTFGSFSGVIDADDGNQPESASAQQDHPTPSDALVRVRRKPMPRKGHTKSRAGCFNCKRRRIKCQETRPACLNCQRAKYACEYPQPAREFAPANNPIMQPQGTPTVFSLSDMRLFHHFLMRGYPHLPIGADGVWTLQVPAIAHGHEYLMHAILALGASHLELTTNSDFRVSAMQHRVKAIGLLSKDLENPQKASGTATPDLLP